MITSEQSMSRIFVSPSGKLSIVALRRRNYRFIGSFQKLRACGTVWVISCDNLISFSRVCISSFFDANLSLSYVNAKCKILFRCNGQFHSTLKELFPKLSIRASVFLSLVTKMQSVVFLCISVISQKVSTETQLHLPNGLPLVSSSIVWVSFFIASHL